MIYVPTGIVKVKYENQTAEIQIFKRTQNSPNVEKFQCYMIDQMTICKIEEVNDVDDCVQNFFKSQRENIYRILKISRT